MGRSGRQVQAGAKIAWIFSEECNWPSCCSLEGRLDAAFVVVHMYVELFGCNGLLLADCISGQIKEIEMAAAGL